MDRINKIGFNNQRVGSVLTYNAGGGHGGGGGHHGGGGGGRHWGGRGRGWGGWGGGWYPYPYYAYPYPYWEYPYSYGNVIILDDKKKKKTYSAAGNPTTPPTPPPSSGISVGEMDEDMLKQILKQKECAKKTGFNLQDLNPKAMTITQGMNRAEFDKCMQGEAEEAPKPEEGEGKKSFDLSSVPVYVWAGLGGVVLGAIVGVISEKSMDKKLFKGVTGGVIGGVAIGGIVAAATYKPAERNTNAERNLRTNFGLR